MSVRPAILDGFEASSIERATALLRSGDIVAFPTETVYGLGADALNKLAVAKIFEVKKRPHFDPLIVHIAREDWLADVARAVPRAAQKLIEKFWPGPLTIIFEKQPGVPEIVTAGLPTVAVRMPSHPVARALISAFGKPVAAPSANPFGYMSPTRASHVARMFHDKLDLVLDGGASTFGLESTIVAVRGEQVIVRRHGAISVEELESVTGSVLHKSEGETAIDAPGQLPYHYAPHKPLVIIRTPDEATNPACSLLLFRPADAAVRARHVRILSNSGDLREAAANFFSYLIELDREDVEVIYAQELPRAGLGRAMMERLKKASMKSLP